MCVLEVEIAAFECYWLANLCCWKGWEFRIDIDGFVGFLLTDCFALAWV
jgi:hypothetical protein